MTLRRFRTVAAFGTPFLEVDGVSLLLLSVEVWDHEVHVAAAAERSDRTAELDAQWAADLRAWERAGREGIPPPCSLPGFRHLLSLSDDVGTRYSNQLASGGGSGMRAYDWLFLPGPGADATTVTVTASGRATPLVPALSIPLG